MLLEYLTFVCTYLEVDQSKEIHSYERISTRPHIHQHDSKSLTKEQQIYKKCKDLHLPVKVNIIT